MRTKEQQKEYMKGYMKRKRANTGANKTGVLTEGANKEGVTLLHRPNGADYNPDELLDGRKRYLGPFSDGQVLDRASVTF